MPNKIIISSGHGKKIRGASGYLDEVDEARRVVEEVANQLRTIGVDVTTYHDDVSTSQNENLNRIVDFHNSKTRDLDISVHFNAYETTSKPMGTECLYVSQSELAADVALAIADAGDFINRGPKKRTDLFFLNNTEEPAILIETCFVDSEADANLYHQNFDLICNAIAWTVSGEQIEPGPQPEPEPEPSPHPTLEKGDQGEAVSELQKPLGLIADGDFGRITETQVMAFQEACNLGADGIVGPKTWDEVDELEEKLTEGERLTNKLINQIVELAKDAPLDKYEWPDRGISPPGYISGMALCYAVAATDLEAGVDYARAMAQSLGSSDVDALKLYEDEFRTLDIDLDTDADCLRALFVLMIGLGMRESSGRYCEGRDMSAENVAADTCEAGLFQTSWNIRSADSSLPTLLDDYWKNPNGFLPIFRENVEPTAENLDCYGSGEGARYQWLAKYSPAFAVMTAGVGLRNRKDHWGPIKRKEVTLRKDAETLLKQVDELLSGVSA